MTQRPSCLGIRPASPGFRSVHIQPELGRLREVDATLPHPDGEFRLRRTTDGSSISGKVHLPAAISGTFAAGGRMLPLRGGINALPTMAMGGETA